MEMRSFIAATFLVALVVSPPAYATSYQLRKLVPADGANIQESADGRQVDFIVRRSNDERIVSESSIAVYRTSGWKYCASNEWDTYSEEVAGNSRRVKQRVAYLHRGRDMIAIIERHFATDKNDMTEDRKATLVAQRLPASEIQSIIDSSRLRCE